LLRHYLDEASIGNRGRRDLPPSCLSALDSVEASADELDGPRHAGGGEVERDIQHYRKRHPA